MTKAVEIAGRRVGHAEPSFVVAEIGINHNGDIDIRAGLHTGEVEMREKTAGVAVHIGARVMAEAGAGEVLVSQTVKDLVAGSGLTFENRGPRALKGVPGVWDLFLAQS